MDSVKFEKRKEKDNSNGEVRSLYRLAALAAIFDGGSYTLLQTIILSYKHKGRLLP